MHSRKRPAPVANTFSASRVSPLTGASTIYIYIYILYIYIYIYIYIHTGGGQKKWPCIKIWLFWDNFCSRTGTYGKRYVFGMHVARSARISFQILILIIGLDTTETFQEFTYNLLINKCSESTLMS